MRPATIPAFLLAPRSDDADDDSVARDGERQSKLEKNPMGITADGAGEGGRDRERERAERKQEEGGISWID